MTSSTKQRYSLAYEHEGEVRHASAELTQSKACIVFKGLPSIRFQVAVSDPEHVVLQLPTDRIGAKPTVSCEISAIPELQAAMDEMRRQGWLSPKVVDTEY